MSLRSWPCALVVLCLEPGMGQPWLLCTGLAWEGPACSLHSRESQNHDALCYGIVARSSMSLESMTEVSWWFPIRKYLGYQSDSGFDSFCIMIVSGWLGGSPELLVC